MALPAPLYYWSFNQAMGNLIPATIGNATITFDTPLQLVDGKIGKAVEFTRINSFAGTVARTDLAELPLPWSLSLWVWRSADIERESAAVLFGSYANGVTLDTYHTDNKVGLAVATVGDYAFGYSAPKNEWIHLVFVANPSGTQLYVNGVAEGAMLPVSSPLGLTWLGSKRGEEDFAAMKLDEAKVFGVELNADQVLELYKNGKPQIHISDGSSALQNNQHITIGDAIVGSPGSKKIITISNTGDADLTLSSIRFDNQDDYQIDSADLPLVLKKGTSHSFTVSFHPKSVGQRNGSLSIVSDDPDISSFVLAFSGNASAAPVVQPPTPTPDWRQDMGKLLGRYKMTDNMYGAVSGDPLSGVLKLQMQTQAGANWGQPDQFIRILGPDTISAQGQVGTFVAGNPAYVWFGPVGKSYHWIKVA